MDWQVTIVSLIVMAALAYIGRSTWRTWFARKSGCGGSCGCSGGKRQAAEGNGHVTLIPAGQLGLRRSREDAE